MFWSELFLSRYAPKLTYYEWNLQILARRFYRMIQSALHDSVSADSCVRIMPRLISGLTLATLGDNPRE